MKPNLSSCC